MRPGRLALWTAPGWYGIRTRSGYYVVRDVRRHPLKFSERYGHGCKRLARIGPWQLWRKP